MPRATRNPAKLMMTQLTRRIRPSLIQLSLDRFNRAKSELIDGIASHPVSIDLSSHSDASPYLSGRKGSLFGFMGFRAGTDPVGDLINFLNTNIKYIAGRRTKRVLYRFSVTIPRKEELNITPLPWINAPWPVLIEEGISNLPYFLSKNAGISREGIQIENVVSNVSFESPSEGYLTPLIATFRKNLLVS